MSWCYKTLCIEERNVLKHIFQVLVYLHFYYKTRLLALVGYNNSTIALLLQSCSGLWQQLHSPLKVTKIKLLYNHYIQIICNEPYKFCIRKGRGGGMEWIRLECEKFIQCLKNSKQSIMYCLLRTSPLFCILLK